MLLINTKLDQIKELSEKLHNIKKYGATEEVIEDTLKYLIPKNDFTTIKVDIKERNNTLLFDLNKEQISLSLEKLNKVIF